MNVINEHLTPEKALRLIWDGYEDRIYFEICTSSFKRSHHQDLDGAIKAAKDAEFYGLLPRKREGSKKPDVIDQGNLLWVDLDFAEAEALVPEVLEPLGLVPTIVVFSGRGFWFLWKLLKPVAKETIERMNKRLVALLDGDSGPTDCTRITRVPGSINKKHAHKPPVEVRFLDGDLRYTIGDFDQALPSVPPAEPSSYSFSKNHFFSPNDRVEGIQWTDPDWLGRPDLAAYVFGDKHDGDRSQIEAQVAAKLLSCGWCSGEIHAFFRKYRLPRYLIDQKTGRAHNLDVWIHQVIDVKSKAWNLKKLNPPLDPPSVHSESGHSPKETENSLSTYDRRRVLVDMARGQTLSEYYEDALEVLGLCQRSTRRDLSLLTYAEGPLVYACDLLDPYHRRKRIYRNEAIAEKVHQPTVMADFYLGSSRKNHSPPRENEKRGEDL